MITKIEYMFSTNSGFDWLDENGTDHAAAFIPHYTQVLQDTLTAAYPGAMIEVSAAYPGDLMDTLHIEADDADETGWSNEAEAEKPTFEHYLGEAFSAANESFAVPA